MFTFSSDLSFDVENKLTHAQSLPLIPLPVSPASLSLHESRRVCYNARRVYVSPLRNLARTG